MTHLYQDNALANSVFDICVENEREDLALCAMEMQENATIYPVLIRAQNFNKYLEGIDGQLGKDLYEVMIPHL
jgi:hypothetical protein